MVEYMVCIRVVAGSNPARSIRFVSGFPQELVETISETYVGVLEKEAKAKLKSIPPEKLKETYDGLIQGFKSLSEGYEELEKKLDEDYAKKLEPINKERDRYYSQLGEKRNLN